MAILGLDHVQLAMPAGQEAAAREFYGGALGMVEIDKPTELAPRGGCWFAAGASIIHLGVETAFQPALKAHPAFVVADLAAWRQRLRSWKIDVVEENSVPRVRRFFANDPFGNRLEFMQAGDRF